MNTSIYHTQIDIVFKGYNAFFLPYIFIFLFYDGPVDMQYVKYKKVWGLWYTDDNYCLLAFG